MRTYFKEGEALRRIDVDVSDIGLAQVESYIAAIENGIKPTTTVLAVIDGADGAMRNVE